MSSHNLEDLGRSRKTWKTSEDLEDLGRLGILAVRRRGSGESEEGVCLLFIIYKCYLFFWNLEVGRVGRIFGRIVGRVERVGR